MGDSSKKHSRKSKLVERTYDEIEDTNEVECNKHNKPLKTKKVAFNQPEVVKPPIELSVQIEVEDGDDGWYKTMLEQERLGKVKRRRKKKKKIEDITLQIDNDEAKTLNEHELKKITKEQAIICIDSSFGINTEASYYKYMLIVETLLLSPYTAYYGPIHYKGLEYNKNRSHSIYIYYCMPCKQKCSSRQQFLTHMAKHKVVHQMYYTVTKRNEVPTFVCTSQPMKYISDGLIADIGIGNIISLVQDYETAIKYVVTKWYRSENDFKVSKGILCYKCYICYLVCEYYSQFINHLNEKHDSLKVIITTEALPDKCMNVVASNEFKPVFKDLTLIPNQLKYKCFKCKRIFYTYDSYRNHSKRINVCAGCGVELPCDQMQIHEGQCNRFLTVFYPKICPCKREFSTAKAMNEHQNGNCNFGRTALVFNCLVCNYLSPSTLRLLIHQRLEHYVRSDILCTGFKINLCHMCGEKYAGSYSRHCCVKRQDIVDCHSCGMLFQNEYFLHVHTTAYPSANCSDCNLKFELSCGLIEHRIKVHGCQKMKIKFICTTCKALLDKPDADGDLSEGHYLELHENSKVYIYSYKKVYISKSSGTYGYHTGIFPPKESKTEENTGDIEDFIDASVIKKSNILSKSNCSNSTSKSKTRSLNLNCLHYDYDNLSNTISQEHNYYDIKQNSAIDDGSYEIEKLNTNIVDDGVNTKIIIQDEFTLEQCTQRIEKIRDDNSVTINTLCNDNTANIKMEFHDKNIIINATKIKEEINDETYFSYNDESKNIILDSFSHINEDMIKCEPDLETKLVKTHVPVTFTPRNDEAEAGCSKDAEIKIKTEATSDEELELVSFNYSNDTDKPLFPKDTGNIDSATEEDIDTLVETKAVKRKLSDRTTRVTKSKPNPDTQDVLTETNDFITVKDATEEVLQVTVDSDVGSSETVNKSIETQENKSQPIKKSAKPRRRRKPFKMVKKKPQTKKKSENQEKYMKTPQNCTKNPDYAGDYSKNTKTSRDTTDELPELGESSTTDTASIKSEIVDNKIQDDESVTVKLEIKEELYEEYETDLIIFDDANSLNESATDEKFVEINPKSDLKESPSKPKIYFCKKCQFTGHHKGYKDHLNLCRKDSPKRSYKPSTKKVQQLTYNCIKCNLECDDLRDYLEHLPLHGYEDKHCPCCSEGYRTLNKLAEHVLKHIKADFKRICFLHLNNKPMELKKFRCCNCKLIVDQEDFFGHWQIHFDRVVVKKQPRDIRTAVMRAEYGEMAKSMALETGVKQEICDSLQTSVPCRICLLCSKPFSRIHDIKRHLIEHLTMDALCNRPNIKSMKCQICQEEFDYTDHYKRHMRDHASLPLYQCQICDKAFSDSSNFGKHKKVHDVFEFVCDICRRKFQCKSSLVSHMMLHEKHKTISCEFCLKKFYFPSTYKKHIRSAHVKGVPKHSCTLCRTRFISVKGQLNHEWREHGLRKTPVDCPLCDQGYRRIIDLKMHLKGAHGMPYFSSKNRTQIEDIFKKHGLSQESINLVFSRMQSAKANND